jgi:hypothetical protein
MPQPQFRTHTGEIVTGERLTAARNRVADWWAENARAIYAENAYAAHVTEATKKDNLQNRLDLAERVRAGVGPMGFSTWQRINTELTGECVAFLP